ncbi:MAG: ABC transporter substrate-binding protein [Desulfovibrio sp.]
MNQIQAEDIFCSRTVRLLAVFLCLFLFAEFAVPPHVRANNSQFSKTAEPLFQREITFGMSADFTGTARALSAEFYIGAQSYFAHINNSGGINGTKVRLLAYDDGYNPKPTIDNTIQLVEQEKVFALFGYVGTPTVSRILPLLRKYASRNLYLLFPVTGAEALRQPPYDKYVYCLRGSYRDETRALVDRLVSLGHRRIAVFYQADAFGRSGWDGVRRALAAHGLNVVGAAAYRRGEVVEKQYAREVELIRSSRPDAIISVGVAEASAGLIRDARKCGLDVPYGFLSFTNGDELVRLLKEHANLPETGSNLRMIFSQIVPSFRDTRLPAVNEYVQLVNKYKKIVRLPYGLDRGWFQPYSFAGFEGYLSARALCAMLEEMGEPYTPSRIPEAMNAICTDELGLNNKFSLCTNSGKQVYFTVYKDGSILPEEHWEEWRKK